MEDNQREISIQGVRTLAQCRICQRPNLETFLSLGPMPLANSFLKQEQLNEPELHYPLDVVFCSNCGLVQLAQVVDPEIMFKDYAYQTGTSMPMREHFARLAETTMQKFKISERSLIMDIGSNDGTLLEYFQKANMRILGIEPAANIAELALSRGIDTLVDFFDRNLADRIRKEHGRPSVILATNVFAHVNDLDDFVDAVNILIADDGVFVIEVPYLMDMIARVEFDTIYHEHLSYFAVRPLVTLFSKFGMNIVDVEKVGVHGGSLRLYVQKSPASVGANVNELLRKEKEADIDSLATYNKFAQDTDRIREELTALLTSLKKQGAKITAYGATAKGNTLLNYCKIGTDLLEYVSDTTPFKQGCYTPGMHIPVFSESRFHESPPDYALLLAWNYAEEILHKENRYRQAGGKFIIPIPRPQII
jgi:novobiocin biosynthesis protein NovU/D-mycarose 3-C-methyltransferase